MPRFLSLRCFIPCLLSLLAVITPHSAGAVDVKPKGTYSFTGMYDYWCTPLPYFRYPVVIHLSAPQRKDAPTAPQPLADVGRLIFSKDSTLSYVPGEVAAPRIASWVILHNKYITDGRSPEQPRLSTEIWDHLLLGLTTLVQDDVVVDHFAVTCGKEQNPDYVLRYEMPPNGLTVNGNPVSFGKALNPLPGMQMMTLRDFESPDTVWCPQGKMRYTPE